MPLPKRVTAPSGNHPGCSVGAGVGVRVGVNVAVGTGVEVESINEGVTCAGLLGEAPDGEQADINNNKTKLARQNIKNFFMFLPFCFDEINTLSITFCEITTCLCWDYRTSLTKTQPTVPLDSFPAPS